ncbi:hypothetical protein L1887_63141 [Cichorium endivia]|nr:hypothetical protein L1887_63141 [Cichorium endivia]
MHVGSIPEREPEKRLPTSKEGSRRANYPILTRGVKKLVVGLWVGSAGPPSGVHRFTRPFCRRCAPGLNWPGRASGAVTLKKLECSKQAYALCSGPHARYTDVFNEYIALADRPGKSLKFHRDGDRSLQLLVFNEEFLVSASHQLALTTSLPFVTHRPSLLPIEWSGEVLGSRRRGRFAAGDVAMNSTEPYHLEEGEVVTRIPVNHRVFERKLRPKPSGRGHACLGVTHRVAPNHASLIGTHGIGGGDWSPVLMVRLA